MSLNFLKDAESVRGPAGTGVVFPISKFPKNETLNVSNFSIINSFVDDIYQAWKVSSLSSFSKSFFINYKWMSNYITCFLYPLRICEIP